MKLRGILIKPQGFATLSFPFCTTLKTENSEMKTSESPPRSFDQTPRFSLSESSVLSIGVDGATLIGGAILIICVSNF